MAAKLQGRPSTSKPRVYLSTSSSDLQFILSQSFLKFVDDGFFVQRIGRMQLRRS